MMADPAPRSQREENERRARRLAALERLQVLHDEILAENGGAPIDVDSVLDEMRHGRDDEQPSDTGIIEVEDLVAIRKPKPERELSPDELRAQRLAAIARMRALHEKVMKRLGGVRVDGDAILREIREGTDCQDEDR